MPLRWAERRRTGSSPCCGRMACFISYASRRKRSTTTTIRRSSPSSTPCASQSSSHKKTNRDYAVGMRKSPQNPEFLVCGFGTRRGFPAQDGFADVVRVENGVLGRLANSGAIREDVSQRAYKYAEIAGERPYFADGVLALGLQRQLAVGPFHENRHWQEWLEESLRRHWARAGTSAAVRRRKSLVQVEMHHVHAEVARTRDAGQRVHVGAVHVQQRALGVEKSGDFADAFLKDPERRRIGDHQRGDVLGDDFAQLLDEIGRAS